MRANAGAAATALAAGALAVVTAVVALRVADRALNDDVVQPMTRAEIAEADRSAPLRPRPRETFPDAGPLRVFPIHGGQVVTRCLADGQAVLTGWSPSLGYHGHPEQEGPADKVIVVFEGGGETVRAAVDCAHGTPHLVSEGP